MKLTRVMFAVFTALMIGAAANMVLGLNALAVSGALLSAGAILPMITNVPEGMVLNAITVEIWQNHIEEEIFKDNAFMRKSHNADEYVLGGKVVHIPQSGGSGNVVKNRTVVPATVRKRTDTDIVYVLDAFTTDPVLIPNVDTKELTYDKRNSVLGEDREKLIQVTAEETLFNWTHSPVYKDYGATSLPAGHKFLTTGAAVPATAPGATGDRNAATLTDLQRLQAYFRSIDRWFEGKMHIMVPPQMLVQMFPADSVITATYMNNVTEAERRMGIIAKAQGFNIWSRSSVLISQANGTIRVPGEAGAVTDGEAALAWYENSVELAMGAIDAFEQLKAPQFYGDVYSFEVRIGGRARREDYKGVAILRQGTPA
jgi:hypothetical protein